MEKNIKERIYIHTHTHTHIKPKQSKENKVQGMIWQAKETKNDTTN